MIKNYIYRRSRTAINCEICGKSFKWNNKNVGTLEKVYKIEFSSIPLVIYTALLMYDGLKNLVKNLIVDRGKATRLARPNHPHITGCRDASNYVVIVYICHNSPYTQKTGEILARSLMMKNLGQRSWLLL